jgi:hypothetical protein
VGRKGEGIRTKARLLTAYSCCLPRIEGGGIVLLIVLVCSMGAGVSALSIEERVGRVLAAYHLSDSRIRVTFNVSRVDYTKQPGLLRDMFLRECVGTMKRAWLVGTCCWVGGSFIVRDNKLIVCLVCLCVVVAVFREDRDRNQPVDGPGADGPAGDHFTCYYKVKDGITLFLKCLLGFFVRS